MTGRSRIALASSLAVTLVGGVGGAVAQEDYLSWNAKKAKSIGEQMRAKGRAKPGFLKTALIGRGLQTERSRSYELRATWMTAETIRATARLLQLRDRFTRKETEAFVRETARSSFAPTLLERYRRQTCSLDSARLHFQIDCTVHLLESDSHSRPSNAYPT